MAMIDGKKISAETREQIALDAQKLWAFILRNMLCRSKLPRRN